MQQLTKRQKQLLKVIIEQYIIDAQPISSKEIVKNFFPKLSSATIRNEMVQLEKHNYLEKTHTSSGRIPSLCGYQYYDSEIVETKSETSLKAKLENIFKQRDLSIDTVIDESITIINESLKLPSIIFTNDTELTLKRFDLIKIDDRTAILILVTSDGTINKNSICFDNSNKKLDDITTCIRIFNDRLVDTPIREIPTKISLIKGIIKNKVHEYEFCIKELFAKILSLEQDVKKQSVKGVHWLATYPEFNDSKKLEKVLNVLENTNVWTSIAHKYLKTGNTSIVFGDDINLSKDLAIASTTINLNSKKHQISVVGPTRMNYGKIKWLLSFIKDELEKRGNNV